MITRHHISLTGYEFCTKYRSVTLLHGRASAHGAMGRQIDSSLWIHQVISGSGQCSRNSVTKVVICALLSVV